MSEWDPPRLEIPYKRWWAHMGFPVGLLLLEGHDLTPLSEGINEYKLSFSDKFLLKNIFFIWSKRTLGEWEKLLIEFMHVICSHHILRWMFYVPLFSIFSFTDYGCMDTVKSILFLTPPLNMKFTKLESIRNWPFDRKCWLSYILFQHCLHWLKWNWSWGSRATWFKLRLILMILQKDIFCRCMELFLSLANWNTFLSEHIAFKCIIMSLMWSVSERICCTLAIIHVQTQSMDFLQCKWKKVITLKLIKEMILHWDSEGLRTCATRL